MANPLSTPFNGRTADILKWIVGLVIAGLVAYFTASIQTEARLTAVETQQRAFDQRQADKFEEIQRSLNRIEADIRELRRAGGGS